MLTRKAGGRRSGAGRPKGSPNQVTSVPRLVVGELARTFTDDALYTLVDIAKNGRTESARVSAAIALLDRGYGRPPQSMELTGVDGKDLIPQAPMGVLIVPGVMTEQVWEKMMSAPVDILVSGDRALES